MPLDTTLRPHPQVPALAVSSCVCDDRVYVPNQVIMVEEQRHGQLALDAELSFCIPCA